MILFIVSRLKEGRNLKFLYGKQFIKPWFEKILSLLYNLTVLIILEVTTFQANLMIVIIKKTEVMKNSAQALPSNWFFIS